MRIAQVSSLWFRVPPIRYGGAEMSTHLLTEGLVEKGHDVTLFASGDSKTKAKLIAPWPVHFEKTGFDYSSQPSLVYLNIHNLIQEHRRKRFDVINFHLSLWSDYIYFLLKRELHTNYIYTVRYTIPDKKKLPLEYEMLSRYKHLSFTSISNAQQKASLKLNWIANIYNSIDQSIYTYSEKPGKYFLSVGAIHPIKGLHRAIQAAKATNTKLIIAGKINTSIPVMYDYWLKQIKPQIDNKLIIYKGETTRKQTAMLMRNAIGFLNPIQWEEPFGLVMLESMASGTPVIVFNRGSAPELVKHGKTGFVVQNTKEMIQAMKKITQIKRQDCFEHVTKDFNRMKMIEAYENVYLKLQ